MTINALLSFFHLLQVTVDGEAAETAGETTSFLGGLMEQGPGSLMVFVVLFIMSIVAVYIIIERYLTLKRAGQVDHSFMNSIRHSVESGNLQAAKALCQSVDAPMARMVAKGLDRIGKPLDDINKAIENVGNLELLKLEKSLSSLATISGIAPMIGLLGTVSGLIISFDDMSTATEITPQVLAAGIKFALQSTAAGLIVAILSMFGYNLLVSTLDKVIFKMENTAVQFMDLLQEPSR